MDSASSTHRDARLDLQFEEPDCLRVRFSGDWVQSRPGHPPFSKLEQALSDHSGIRKIQFDFSDLNRWDSTLLAFLFRFKLRADRDQLEWDNQSVPKGIQELIQLAATVPERTDAKRDSGKTGLLVFLGNKWINAVGVTREVIRFLGETTLAAGRLVRGRAQFQTSDLFLFIQQTGYDALGITLLISFLVGLILAFVGAIQLQQFGASIYVANLVALAMVREMGCLMTAIIMSGRTGAAFAAQLGTMKVNQEIDAFKTFSFSPIEFLVLPRMLALFLMMPLLTVFANLSGILGGFLIGVFMLDLSYIEYWNQTVGSLTLTHCMTGFIKSFVFGILVAFCGCFNGMRCPNNAAGVGLATTSAVVSGITAIIVADAVFAVIFDVLKI